MLCAGRDVCSVRACVQAPLGPHPIENISLFQSRHGCGQLALKLRRWIVIGVARLAPRAAWEQQKQSMSVNSFPSKVLPRKSQPRSRVQNVISNLLNIATSHILASSSSSSSLLRHASSGSVSDRSDTLRLDVVCPFDVLALCTPPGRLATYCCIRDSIQSGISILNSGSRAARFYLPISLS